MFWKEHIILNKLSKAGQRQTQGVPIHFILYGIVQCRKLHKFQIPPNQYFVKNNNSNDSVEISA